ncbi:ATP-binding protein [Deinococcus hohokamensis]|uniref:ATP-binding protein n=1 Tax=Deinococcus hohokamensis TaxID=309883 RepID=A0ABV9I7I5_9DEIO
MAIAVGPNTLLLILDNFEQVLDAAPDLGQLLGAVPHLKVVVTSRTVLHLRGEHELFVGPLSDHPPDGSTGPSDAEALFALYARTVNPRFVLNESNREDVQRICRLLGGIPLALELAAARLRAVSTAGLLAWLDRPLDVLTAGPSDGPHHGQSLREAIGWSADLLTLEEREIFTACGAFVGGFSLPALAAVTDAAQPLAVLIRLVEYSLIQPVDPASAAGTSREARWSLLEPIREFAVELLKGAEHSTVLLQRHAEYFLSLAERAQREVELLSPDSQAQLQADDANLCAALTWFTQQNQGTEALRLVLALGPYWEGGSQHQVELDWSIRALSLPSTHQEPKLRADVLCARAYCEQDLQQLRTTRRTLEEAIDLYEGLHDEAGKVQALRILATVHSGLEQFPEALSLLGDLKARFEASGDAYLLCETLHNTAAVYMRLNQNTLALPFLEQAQPLAEQTNYRNGLGFILMLRVWVSYLEGPKSMPVHRVQEAWNVSQELHLPNLTSMMILVLASYAREAGKYAFAAQLFSLAEHLHAPLGHPWTSCFLPQVHRLETELRALLRSKYERERATGLRLGLESLSSDIAAWLADAGHGVRRSTPMEAVKVSLTAREQEVLRCVAQGHTDKRIAQLLSISAGTVSKHVANALGKLGLHNRVELARWAAQHGLSDAEEVLNT